MTAGILSIKIHMFAFDFLFEFLSNIEYKEYWRFTHAYEWAILKSGHLKKIN